MQYNTILLDPPWPYDRTHGQGIAKKEYDLMTWADIAELGPQLHTLAAPDCAILVWVTAPLLIEQTDIVRAWGFRYITKAFSWVKTTPKSGAIFFGIGSYTASNTEDVWLLSNGTPARLSAAISQIVADGDAVVAPRARHSKKPEEIQNRIERLFDGPRLEVFARRRRPGWTCVGNELDGLDIRESLARLAQDAPLPVAERTMAEQHSFLEAA